MLIQLLHEDRWLSADLSKPLDLSIPLSAGPGTVSAWYCDPVKIEPVVMGSWIGDVNRGGSVNFRNVFLNPHGNGTHTECVGHISREVHTLNAELKSFFAWASVVSVTPELSGGDQVIGAHQLSSGILAGSTALIIRTLPNNQEKKSHNYSNTNPPYLAAEAANLLVERGILHLLIDLPSVDREQDEGKLTAHHIFWNYPQNPRKGATISELIYVPDEIEDGFYLLNLMITALENDASPSKPVLYRLNG